jgi:chemotaxis methyl-accepting protein methylase
MERCGSYFSFAASDDSGFRDPKCLCILLGSDSRITRPIIRRGEKLGLGISKVNSKAEDIKPSGDAMRLASKRTGWLRASVRAMSHSRLLRRYIGRPYFLVNIWIWNHLPASVSHSYLGWAYGAHLHRLIHLRSVRRQQVGTFFFRNRPELELLIRLLNSKRRGSTLELTVLGCSKGAEVYSFSYSIHAARPDLRLTLHAVDIDPGVLEFAKEGLYSLKGSAPGQASVGGSFVPVGDLAAKTFKDQMTSVFERMSSEEIDAMFERDGDEVKVKPCLREALTWHVGDASDPKLADVLGLQDIVVANRFLCHMQPADAEPCLRSLARLVKPGGYLFVSGVDLGVRTKVARDLGWLPVTESIEQIHEGDASLRRDWPLQYWGLEPFDKRRDDRDIRYASVFQLSAETSPTEVLGEKPQGLFVHAIQ